MPDELLKKTWCVHLPNPAQRDRGEEPRCRAALRRRPERASPQIEATARLINGSLPMAVEPNKPVRQIGFLRRACAPPQGTFIRYAHFLIYKSEVRYCSVKSSFSSEDHARRCLLRHWPARSAAKACSSGAQEGAECAPVRRTEQSRHAEPSLRAAQAVRERMAALAGMRAIVCPG